MPPKADKFASQADLAEMFRLWRANFLDALERRDHGRCQALLNQLQRHSEPWLQHAHQHYMAVLLMERHRYDAAEKLLRALLSEPLSQEQRPRSLMELAILFDEQGEWAEADRCYSEAAAAYAAASNPLGIAKVDNNWAISLCFRFEQGSVQPMGQPPLLPRTRTSRRGARWHKPQAPLANGNMPSRGTALARYLPSNAISLRRRPLSARTSTSVSPKNKITRVATRTPI
ncbi:MAG: hypothetical protein IPK16_28140 [Anaerolineales bacterium]|nr:hypothetical protein [Anaerolineales bacterium]